MLGEFHHTVSFCQTTNVENNTGPTTPLFSFFGSFGKLVLPDLALVLPYLQLCVRKNWMDLSVAMNFLESIRLSP
jgi:hypothetical protein